MTVGIQITKAQIDASLTSMALQMRSLMSQIKDLNSQINGGGENAPVGVAALEAAGYSATDAATALQFIGLLNNLSGVYFNTATVSATFDFNNALAQLWGGQ